MKHQTIPLSVPGEMAKAVRRVAKQTSLSQADVMRHSIRLGLPDFEAKFPKPQTTKTTIQQQ